MAGGKEKVEVVLDDGSDAVVVRGGIKVQFNASGGIDIYGNVPVTLHPAANDAVKSTTSAALRIGDPDDGSDVVVVRGGIKVQFNAIGGIDIYGNVPVTLHPAANDDVEAKAGATPQVGDPDDGGVYVGKSATNGRDLHAALADEREYMTFDEALEAAAKMRKQPGRENAHVPTPEELDKNLFAHKDDGALKGTFNTSGSFPGSVYRSSAPCGNDHARVRWFNDRGQYNGCRNVWQPVRLVW